ncbi:MAG: PPOX class F420-dependent oxidoreductase [Candidatus Dormibacteraeota bacterium]|uniref:PPOX class F420-dependent oxidoreductase n=1 Tax=Candidatus Amunia macphersoniae TaxID=3127014 RepID=A0A934KPL0_9BACT|nr:PPOX class F420-dependent oxidoreductase [Candidatus Dormibacteraeota bacterium]
MDHQDALDFLRQNGQAVLATHRRDGGVQLSPVLATVDDESRVVVSTRETAIKTLNLRREPRASLCAISQGFFGEWHTVEGTVEIVSLPAAMDGLIDYYRRASGEHPDWDEYRRAMEAERRVLLRLDVQRSGPRVQG